MRSKFASVNCFRKCAVRNMSYAVLQQPRRATTRCAAKSPWKRDFPRQRMPQARSTDQNKHIQKYMIASQQSTYGKRCGTITQETRDYQQKSTNAELAKISCYDCRISQGNPHKMMSRNVTIRRPSHGGEARCFSAHMRLRFP